MEAKTSKSERIAEKLMTWMEQQKIGGENILHASVCCDFAGRSRFKRKLVEIIANVAQKGQGEVSPLKGMVSDNRRWKDVREELPDEGEQVLVHSDDVPVAVGYLLYNESGYTKVWSVDYGCMDSRRKNITHWQPLPKTPE